MNHAWRATLVDEATDFKARFDALKNFYDGARAEIAACPYGWGVDPRAIAWARVFSPIELAMWEALRSQRVWVYPQFPIGRYFADFAHPAAGLVIECDGAAFHRDRQRDRERQKSIEEMGWSVMRITGRDCLLEEDDPEKKSALWIFVQDVRDVVAARLQRGENRMRALAPQPDRS